MPTPQSKGQHKPTAAMTEQRRLSAAGLATRSSRFARAARDPQWTQAQSAQQRADLARQAAIARRELAARRLAQAA